ncbi:hypothetical protein GCM10009609_41130 [Pseudonocardia aurantiaca]|uniref:Uncharacterized protein n=1 Tax=Pseudonocardia aurantiaca TaxID=75290 RepID=A0ABW4FR34_9PSEU
MIVTGFDDRQGCGYVLRTGADASEALPGGQDLRHEGKVARMTAELAAALRDALANNPTAMLGWQGPRVPLTFDDATLLAWLTYDVGGVIAVRNPPPPHPRAPRPTV